MKKFINAAKHDWTRCVWAMDVIIRGVRARLYREFKAQAAKMGLRLSEALQKAIESWLLENSSLTLAMSDPDQLAFAGLMQKAERRYHGKYVGVYGGGKLVVAEGLDDLVGQLKEAGVSKAVVSHVGVDESGEGGEWLWGSIER